MNVFRSIPLLIVTLLFLAVPAVAQDYKETFNEAREAAAAKDYATAHAKYLEAIAGADAADDAEVARTARYVAAQIDNAMGTQALKAENFEKALQHHTQGAELFPEYIRNHYGRGLALKKLGRIEEALQAWQGILGSTQDRRTALAAENAIRDHFNFQAASAISKRSVTPNDGDRVLAVLENYQQYLDPDADFYYFMALAYSAKGEHAQSVVAADQALAIHRGSRTDAAKIHFAKGEALVRVGDTAGAREAFTNAAFGPHKPAAEHYLSTL